MRREDVYSSSLSIVIVFDIALYHEDHRTSVEVYGRLSTD